MNRLVLAFRVFWKTLVDPDFAARVTPLVNGTAPGPDLRVLAVLQRDGRLVDFLLEDIDPYTDAQIGAAARDIHKGCSKALREYLTLDPVLAAEEGSQVTLPADFDPAAVRLSGNVVGSPPFNGVLKHHGWRVKGVRLPTLPGSEDNGVVIAPAEVEIP